MAPDWQWLGNRSDLIVPQKHAKGEQRRRCGPFARRGEIVYLLLFSDNVSESDYLYPIIHTTGGFAMTTPTIEQIHSHSSIRAYKPDPVLRGLVEIIVAAGQRASTSSNMQFTTAVAVTDESKRMRLAELCGDQEHIRQAPVFIAWCVDRARLDHACQTRGYEQKTDTVESFLVAAMDVAIFMQNAALAAESLGLGMCYIGAIRNNPRQVIELLGLPPLTFPVSGMTLGWPAGEAIIRPRLALETVLHWESYGDPNEAEHLHAYDQAMAATGIYDNRQVPVPGQPEQLEAYGWTEHSARRVSQRGRADLREILAEQGFALAD